MRGSGLCYINSMLYISNRMNAARNFRYIIESVEFAARRSDAILYESSQNLWDDIIEAYDRREYNRNFWTFAIRWIREQLIREMQNGRLRSLKNILAILKPESENLKIQSKNHQQIKRVLIANLLPIFMTEITVRVRNQAEDRLSPYDYDEYQI